MAGERATGLRALLKVRSKGEVPHLLNNQQLIPASKNNDALARHVEPCTNFLFEVRQQCDLLGHSGDLLWQQGAQPHSATSRHAIAHTYKSR